MGTKSKYFYPKIKDFKDYPKYIKLDWEVYRKMMFFCLLAPGEISGFAKCVKDVDYSGDKIFRAVEARIFKQECTAAHTELDAEDLANFIVDLAKSNENPAHWNIWWHTHHDFGAFFSGTDVATINKLSSNGKLFSICLNKFGEITARLDEKGETYPITPVIIPPQEGELFEHCLKEVKEKVKVRKYHAYTRKGKDEEDPVLETTGLGQSSEVDRFPDYDGRSWRDRLVHDYYPC